MKKILIFICLSPCLAFGLNLQQAYQLGLRHDPIYLKTRASDFANSENVAINRAKLLPNLSASGNLSDAHRYYQQGWLKSDNYAVTLQQSLINFSDWKNLSASKLMRKSNTLNTLYALQNVITDVSQAYFAIANDQAIISIDHKQVKANALLSKQTEQYFKAGQKTKADVANAKTAYLTSKSTLLQAEIQLANDKAKLTQLTGKPIKSVKTLNSHIPILSPKPFKLATWLTKTKQQNMNINAKRFAVYSMDDQIKVASYQHIPMLSGSLSYNHNYNYNQATANSFSPSVSSNDTVAAVNLNIPIFSGGSMIAKTKQADYQYQATEQDLAGALFTATSNTRAAYTAINKNSNKIKILKRAIHTAHTAMLATCDDYQAGISGYTMLNVVQAENNYYQLKSNLITATYHYLQNTLNLKKAAGIINDTDLIKINHWSR